MIDLQGGSDPALLQQGVARFPNQRFDALHVVVAVDQNGGSLRRQGGRAGEDQGVGVRRHLDFFRLQLQALKIGDQEVDGPADIGCCVAVGSGADAGDADELSELLDVGIATAVDVAEHLFQGHG